MNERYNERTNGKNAIDTMNESPQRLVCEADRVADYSVCRVPDPLLVRRVAVHQRRHQDRNDDVRTELKKQAQRSIFFF